MRIKYNDTIKTLGPQAARFVTALHERQHLLFQLEDVIGITGLKPASARSFIRQLVGRGIAARLRPGLYNLVPFELGREKEFMGNPYVVARELIGGRGYYVSHGSAMSIHRMTTQPQLVVHVTSPRPMRNRTILGTEFRFIRCKPNHLFGVAESWVNKQEKIMVSDPERTILDGLKAPEYCGGITEVAKALWMRRDAIDTKKLVRYAVRLDVTAVINRLGHLMEVLEVGSQTDLESLRRRLTATYVLFDPLLPAEGKFLARWRLRLNVSAEEIKALLRT
ncbi:MAG: type IV toxin-antitoxin system AbiEi family antitoxin [Elusimicrobiota bacterium]